MYINWESNRRHVIEKYKGITFINYIVSDSTLQQLLGEHGDMINARKIISEYHDSIDLNHLLATGEVIYKDNKKKANTEIEMKPEKKRDKKIEYEQMRLL